MSDFGNKIMPGQKELPARPINEMAEAHRRRQNQPRQNENQPRDYDQIKVESGFSRNMDILETTSFQTASWPVRENVIFEQEGRRNGVELLGGNPETKWDQVGVLQQAMPYRESPNQAFAQAVISGPTPCYILFDSEESLDFPFAVPISANSKNMFKASPYGLNRILWHAEPENEIEPCEPVVLQGYVNMGEDEQWAWFKLEDDLPCCGSVQGKVVDQCGNDITSCPIYEQIWGPRCMELCTCDDEETPSGWKKDDIVPAWWYQYLEKWVTIPNFTQNFEEKEQEVVTSLEMTGGTITPSSYEQVLASFIVHTNLINLVNPTDVSVECTGSISLDDDVAASGTVTVSGNIGTAQNPVRLDVVSACDDVTITGGSISSSSNLELSGTMSTSATVNVPLGSLALSVSGSASGSVNVSGPLVVAGPLVLTGTLPASTVTGTATITNHHAPLTATATVTDSLVNLAGGSPKTVTRINSFTSPTLTRSALTIPELNGSISGTLSNATTASVSLAGVSASIDLSAFFEEADAVDPDTFEFTGCTLNWDTMKVLKLAAGKTLNDLANIPITISGSISIPSTVTGTSNHDAQTNVPDGVGSWNAGGIDKENEEITVPTHGTINAESFNVTGYANVNGTFPVNGTANWTTPVTLPGASINAGTVSMSGNVSLPVSGTASGAGGTASGTATVSAPVTVSGPLNISSGLTITGELARTCPQYAQGVISGVSLSNSEVSLPVTGSINDERQCTVPVPTQLYLQPNAIEPTYVQIPKEFTLSGATISGTTTTIKYIGCKPCEEEEEETEEESA